MRAHEKDGLLGVLEHLVLAEVDIREEHLPVRAIGGRKPVDPRFSSFDQGRVVVANRQMRTDSIFVFT